MEPTRRPEPTPSAPRLELIEPGAGAPATVRHARGGTVTLGCELRTPRVLQFYRRDFPQVSHWLQGLDRTRRIRRIAPRTVDEAEHAIASHLSRTRADFDRLAQEADTLMVLHGVGHVPIRYAAPVTVAAPIAHPIARVYLHTLGAADNAFSALERAWLLGLLDTRERRQREAALRKALHGLAGAVRVQYAEMARRVRTDAPASPAADGSAVLADEPVRTVAPAQAPGIAPGLQRAPGLPVPPPEWMDTRPEDPALT